jgi:hypothetical protein
LGFVLVSYLKSSSSSSSFSLWLWIEPDKSCLQFGKQDENEGCRFALDYRWPLSPVQAFGIFLTSCVWVGPKHKKE